jgi:hypothetical protein
MNDEEAHEFYKDPKNLRAVGPWYVRRRRPGVISLRYAPPECGPQTQTVNAGMQPYWEKNPYWENHPLPPVPDA